MYVATTGTIRVEVLETSSVAQSLGLLQNVDRACPHFTHSCVRRSAFFVCVRLLNLVDIARTSNHQTLNPLTPNPLERKDSSAWGKCVATVPFGHGSRGLKSPHSATGLRKTTRALPGSLLSLGPEQHGMLRLLKVPVATKRVDMEKFTCKASTGRGSLTILPCHT